MTLAKRLSLQGHTEYRLITRFTVEISQTAARLLLFFYIY